MLPDDDARRAAAEGEFAPGLGPEQVDFLMREEWAHTAEDILWRRTKLGLVASPEQVVALERYIASRAAGAAAPAPQTASR
jgi:glycerol-3-phosphate dehydrogenase